MKSYLSLLILSISTFIPNALCINKNNIKNNRPINLKRSVNLSKSKRYSRPKNDKIVNAVNIKHRQNRAHNSTNFRADKNSRLLNFRSTRLSKGLSLAAGGAIALASLPIFLCTGSIVSYVCLRSFLAPMMSIMVGSMTGVVILGGAALMASPFFIYGLSK